MVEFAIDPLGMTLSWIESTRRAGSVNCPFKWLDVGKICDLRPEEKTQIFGRPFGFNGLFAVLLKRGQVVNQICDVFRSSSKNGTTKTCRMRLSVPR